MTESFGARLKRQREQQRMSLGDIAASTKINIALFRGLEKDDVSRWPAGIFRRSFIRAYAEAIGLDPDAVCREFLARFPEAEDQAAQSTVPRYATVAPPAVPQSRTSPPRIERSSPRIRRGPGGPDSTVGLRLTMAEARPPFSAGRVLGGRPARWRAASWDVGTLMAVGGVAYVVLHAFWMPLGIAALCYYAGSILLLGNTPGVCLFAPNPEPAEDHNPVGASGMPAPIDHGRHQLGHATSASLSISSEVA
jgi:transcriptional regulator with XRE-family HTH domain